MHRVALGRVLDRHHPPAVPRALEDHGGHSGARVLDPAERPAEPGPGAVALAARGDVGDLEMWLLGPAEDSREEAHHALLAGEDGAVVGDVDGLGREGGVVVAEILRVVRADATLYFGGDLGARRGRGRR